MDIKIGPEFSADTPIDDILSSIRIEPTTVNIDYPQAEQDIALSLIEPRHTFTLDHEQAKSLANMTVAEGKRWAMGHFGIEDEAAAYTITAVGIGLHRALSDLGLLVKYKISFSMD